MAQDISFTLDGRMWKNLFSSIYSFVSLFFFSPQGLPILRILFSLGARVDQMSRIGSDSQGPPGSSVSVTDFIVARFGYYLLSRDLGQLNIS